MLPYVLGFAPSPLYCGQKTSGAAKIFGNCKLNQVKSRFLAQRYLRVNGRSIILNKKHEKCLFLKKENKLFYWCVTSDAPQLLLMKILLHRGTSFLKLHRVTSSFFYIICAVEHLI